MSSPKTSSSDDLMGDALYYGLFEQAEQVRWKVNDIPWSLLEHDKVTPALRQLVRAGAFAELTTFSATQQFMHAFGDDVDLSQWMCVWFYEETKHPRVLMEWLRRCGDSFDSDFLLRGRVSEPFMPSRVGTLVSNIISEITAANRYRNQSRRSPEPLLARITAWLAADEARHAGGFYSYARRYIERAQHSDAERLTALKILHLWLNQNGTVQHPVNRHVERVKQSDELAATALEIHQPEDLARTRRQASRMIGNLVGLPIDSAEDVMPQIRALIPTVRRRKSTPSAHGAMEQS